MTTRKKTTATPKKSVKRAAKKAASKPAPRPAFSLQVGHSFSLLTQKVAGGVVTAQPPVAAGGTLEVWYWKEPQQLARPDSQFTSVKLHSRIDGEDQPVLELGHAGDAGQFIRTGATLDLPASARHLEYWFELTTSSNETLWDSNWGKNYWLDASSASGALAVEVLYDASMDSPLAAD